MNLNLGQRVVFVVAAGLTLALAASASAFSLWPNDLPKHASLYRVHAYLDEAPKGVNIRDRIQITARGHEARELLVTDYGTPGETSLDLDLSRAMGRRYSVTGNDEQVAELFSTPKGKELDAMFLAYTDGPPYLVISSLDYPGDQATAKPES